MGARRRAVTQERDRRLSVVDEELPRGHDFKGDRAANRWDH